MKLLFLLFIFVSSIFAKPVTEADALKEWHNLSPSQIDVMNTVWNFGSKYNLSWTMTAICWKESKFGLISIPLSKQSDDFGIMQINLAEYFRSHNIKYNSWNRSKFASLFVRDDIKCLNAAKDIILELALKKPKHSGWRWVWSRYNQGYNVTHIGESYASDIATYIRVMKKIANSDI
jgi:hypothetical protein